MRNLVNDPQSEALAESIWTFMLERQAEKRDDAADALWQRNVEGRTLSPWAIGVVGSVGLMAMVTTLVSGFGSFYSSLLMLVKDGFAISDLFFTPVLAETARAVQGNANLIAPVFVYGIYLLFAIAYLCTLMGLFWARTPKDRSNASEVFKTLNAFFIGAVSGKLI
jgi:hypothetical protein